MDKDIKKSLIQFLDLEFSQSSLKDDTDLDFQTYLENKYGIKDKNNFEIRCDECKKLIEKGKMVAFEINTGNHENHKKEKIFLDIHCLFKEYTLPLILKRTLRYWKQ